MIYLDNSATTRIDDDVLDSMLPWLRNDFGNASSAYFLGRKARVAIENAREEIAHCIGAHPAEFIFTSGGTESNNTVLKSVCRESNLAKNLVVSSIEHHAILQPAEELQREGFSLDIVPVNAEGFLVAEDFSRFNQPRTLISVMHANNETGAIQPIAAIRNAAPNALLHTDAVQSFGKTHFSVQTLGVDFASFSAHKIHAPKGIGGLFIRKGIDFKAHQQGGAQERNRRGGTESVALIVGFQTAVRNAVRDVDSRTAQMLARTRLLRELLSQKITDFRFNTPTEDSLPNIINISFLDAENLDGEGILQAMDMRHIAVSNGSACVSGSMQPSHVLLALGRPLAEAKAGLRFSVSKDTTAEEITTAVEVLAEILDEMRK